MNLNQQLSTVKWKQVIGTALTSLLIILVLSTAYDAWKKRNGWCIQFHPNGSEQRLYGHDCQK